MFNGQPTSYMLALSSLNGLIRGMEARPSKSLYTLITSLKAYKNVARFFETKSSRSKTDTKGSKSADPFLHQITCLRRLWLQAFVSFSI